MLVRNHLLCPYTDCNANKRTGNQRIMVLVDEERNVDLHQSSWKPPHKTKLEYKYELWEKTGNCPFCKRPVEVVIDETHNGRNIYIRLPKGAIAKPPSSKKVTPATKTPSDSSKKTFDKQEILLWNRRYDEDHPWWTQKEKELGDKFRRARELTKDDLVQLVEWKFKGLKGRKDRILGLIVKNHDVRIRRISRDVFNSTLHDSYKIDSLQMLHGVGPALASTILTFYDPKKYGVFDIHVWREMFGKEPENLFTTENYLKLLTKLRKIADKHGLDVRTVEKAFFKKNKNETSSRSILL